MTLPELGPILPEDGLLLTAIIKMTTPKTLVEFGHYWGASARVILEAMDDQAVLHSYDNTKLAAVIDPRFTFHHQSQTEIDGISDIDFVFLDASHELELNKETFIKLLPNLSEKAIIAVHDTGSWVGGNVFGVDRGVLNKDGTYTHCPEEVAFVDWIKTEHPDFQQIHFHSHRAIRYGITLLQKYVCL